MTGTVLPLGAKPESRGTNLGTLIKLDLWVAGHADAIVADDVFRTLMRWVNDYGPLVKLRILQYPVVIVTDPDSIQQILRRTPNYLAKDRELYRALEVGASPQVPTILSASDGPYYKAVRSAVAACLSVSNLKKVRMIWVSQGSRMEPRL